MTDLGTLGGSLSYAFGINASGQVLGESYTTGNANEHVFLYSGGVMTDLNDLIPGGSGVTIEVHFEEGEAINNQGQIAALGLTSSGQEHAMLLAPRSVPPPSSLSGVVFSDFNNDGQVDFGEQGIAGVTIKLDGTDDLGNAVHLSQTTDANGAYVFLDLRPGSYTITEPQVPADYTQGINSVGTAGGTVSGDTFTITNLAAGTDGLNYNFGEQPAATGAIVKGQTAGIGFWNNKNGQALIKALNGGPTSTQLGNWLAATFPHMFGAQSGSNDLVGKSNADVASFFQSRFVVKDQKLDAQVLATALSVYVTDGTLDSTGVGTQYGFIVGGNGVATATFNVGTNGDAFGVANNTLMTVLDFLLAADAQAVNGVLYNGDTAKRNMANNVFSAINQAGGI
jgi:probable HAF family extracellular repeat protein